MISEKFDISRSPPLWYCALMQLPEKRISFLLNTPISSKQSILDRIPEYPELFRTPSPCLCPDPVAPIDPTCQEFSINDWVNQELFLTFQDANPSPLPEQVNPEHTLSQEDLDRANELLWSHVRLYHSQRQIFVFTVDNSLFLTNELLAHQIMSVNSEHTLAQEDLDRVNELLESHIWLYHSQRKILFSQLMILHF
jgi:hypothetical protein